MTSAIEPRRIALRFTPPGIIVEYSYGQSRHASVLYHHEIDLQDELRSFRGSSTDESAISEIVRSLIRQHDQVLGNQRVSVQQLQRLVRKLVDQVASSSVQRTDPPPSVVLPQADYNRVSETQLKQVKAKMDVLFEQNLVRPDQVDFQYDKQVSFEPPQETSDWDD